MTRTSLFALGRSIHYDILRGEVGNRRFIDGAGAMLLELHVNGVSSLDTSAYDLGSPQGNLEALFREGMSTLDGLDRPLPDIDVYAEATRLLSSDRAEAGAENRAEGGVRDLRSAIAAVRASRLASGRPDPARPLQAQDPVADKTSDTLSPPFARTYPDPLSHAWARARGRVPGRLLDEEVSAAGLSFGASSDGDDDLERFATCLRLIDVEQSHIRDPIQPPDQPPDQPPRQMGAQPDAETDE